MRPLYKGAAWGLIFAFGLSSDGMAQTVQIPLDKLDPDTAAQILKVQRRLQEADQAAKTAEVPKTPTEIKEWASIGTEVANALAATARALSVEVNEFVKTPVGQGVAFLIIWKLIGAKFWTIIAGTIIWLALGTFLIKNFRRLHFPREAWVKGAGPEGKGEWRDQSFKWNSKDAKATSAVAHCFAFIVLSFVCMLAIL